MICEREPRLSPPPSQSCRLCLAVWRPLLSVEILQSGKYEDLGDDIEVIYRFKGGYQIFGEEVVNNDDVEVQELCHGAENVGSDGLEILHQMDVLSAEAQQHQGSICQDGQLKSPSVSRRGAAKV